MAVLVCTVQRPWPEAAEYSAEEHKTRRDEIDKSFEENGGKHIARASTDVGGRMIVDEFPDYESYMNHRKCMESLCYFMIFDVKSFIGISKLVE